MDTSRLPEPIRARLEAGDAAPPLETVRAFLRGYVTDTESLDEVRADLRRVAAVSTRSLRRDLVAVESVLAAPPPPDGTLAHLVEWDANWVLNESSDAAAVEFLGELAQLLSTVIAEAEAR